MGTGKLPLGTTVFIAATISLGFTVHGLITTAHALSLPACSAETGLGTACICSLSSLHPMQGAVGMLEVKKRVNRSKA
jgi:hypothetical protein